jgi:prophage maintenance system killer protein
MATVIFLEFNGSDLEVHEDDAVETMLAVAAGQFDETSMTEWLRQRVRRIDEDS